MAPSDPIRLPAAAEGFARRDFCLAALAAGLTLACSGGGGSGTSTAPPPPPTGVKTTTDTKAALLATPDGTVRDYRNLGGFLLIRDATGIYAMTTVCTHMGCTVGLPISGTITCPCHGSQYSLAGANLLGPATKPLVHYKVIEPSAGAFLEVDTGTTVTADTRLT
jgi:nitrite reductase/ring-hydroxylating ferredoxin subunit